MKREGILTTLTYNIVYANRIPAQEEQTEEHEDCRRSFPAAKSKTHGSANQLRKPHSVRDL